VVNGSGLNPAVQYLQALLESETAEGLSDGQLLDRFVTRREGAFLEALVRRHGPMVWGVCRRVLRDHHDAEDAFQATFLVLARRAASVLPREKVGNWLYGVAYQTARKARATRAKRRLREGQIPDAPEPEAASHAPRGDLAELLDHELSRLPDKYRTPVVLCELQGKTHHEAAEQLGWPIGTVSGRLSRARSMLAERLIRRGVSTAGASLAVLLAQGVASACVPASLLSSTAKAASWAAAGRAVMAEAVSSEVAALAGEVLSTMLLSRVKIAAGALLLALSFAGAGLWQARTWAGGQAPADEKPRAAPAAVSGTAAPEPTFRVTVNEVIRDEGAVVTQVSIETSPGAKIEVLPDKDQRGSSFSLSTDGAEASRKKGPAAVQLLFLVDQVQGEWKGGSANAVKFLMGYKIGSISSSTSQTIPMPEGAKQLADVLKLPIKSGEYKYGPPTKLLTFNGVTYNLVVSRPE
jgi:RNA polymerase sigma factor (sigma-70 family)